MQIGLLKILISLKLEPCFKWNKAQIRVEIMEPEGQKQSLLSCVSNITVNWMGHDLMLQKNTQVNIL